MEFIGVECLRETEAGALYSVHKVEQGGLLYIFYNTPEFLTEITTNEIRNWYYVPKRLSSSDFDSMIYKNLTITCYFKYFTCQMNLLQTKIQFDNLVLENMIVKRFVRYLESHRMQFGMIFKTTIWNLFIRKN